jgi:hypothetical protein
LTKSLEKFQSLLPLGYLYLIVLGIMKESLRYYQLNINILKYSSLMDILISPIADLTSKPVILLAVLFLVSIALALQIILTKNSQRKWVQKFLSQGKSEKILEKEEIRTIVFETSLVFLMVALASFFVGTGLSDGEKVVKKIRSNGLSYSHKISFDSDKQEDVYLIDSNSSYFFYVSKGNKNVKIAPVGSIKNIELTGSQNAK